MLDLDIEYRCHWHDQKCDRQHDCDGCSQQPADEDKVNGKAEPLPLRWTEDYEGHKYPECPACGEMPYDMDRCVFCGQRFLSDSRAKKWKEPAKIETMTCFVCGVENAIQFVRAYNGHRHGCCTACGISFME